MIKWGSIHRLIGSTAPTWVVEHLFLDSLLFLNLIPPTTETLMDLGSGPGVPGVPIKIVRPELQVTLVEARQRKVSFLSTVVRELGLAQTRVVNARAEAAPEELHGTFDAVVMRCAGDLGSVLTLAARFVVPGGLVIASGPPQPRGLPSGEWIQIPGVRPGSTRAFVRLRV